MTEEINIDTIATSNDSFWVLNVDTTILSYQILTINDTFQLQIPSNLTLINDGIIITNVGIYNIGTITNGGTITNDGGTITNDGGTINNNSVGIINNNIDITGEICGTIHNNGTINNNGGTINNNIDCILHNSDLLNIGIINNENGGIINNDGTLNNNENGTITNNTGSTINNN